MSLFDKVKRNCVELGVLNTDRSSPKAVIILAVSGGVDSIALLNLLRQICNIEVVSINHNVRADSHKEIELVQKICKADEIPFKSFDLDADTLKVKNFQNNARIARYNLLIQYAKERNIGWIATAHHLDDLMETFLLKIMRGVGISGLQTNNILTLEGIKIVRPLFNIEKAELLDFAINNQLSWIDDPSNQTLSYTRNKIRAGVEAFFHTSRLSKQDLYSGLLKTLHNLESAGDVINNQVDNLYSEAQFSPLGYFHIDISYLGPLVLFELLKKILPRMGYIGEIRGDKIHHIAVEICRYMQSQQFGNKSSASIGHSIALPCKWSIANVMIQVATNIKENTRYSLVGYRSYGRKMPPIVSCKLGAKWANFFYVSKYNIELIEGLPSFASYALDEPQRDKSQANESLSGDLHPECVIDVLKPEEYCQLLGDAKFKSALCGLKRTLAAPSIWKQILFNLPIIKLRLFAYAEIKHKEGGDHKGLDAIIAIPHIGYVNYNLALKCEIQFECHLS